MDLSLHIGQQKTATTSLQKFLEINYKNLIGQKFLYPKSLGDLKQLFIYKRIDELLDQDSALYKVFLKEKNKPGIKEMIISEENLFTLKTPLKEKVTQFINREFDSVKLIVYLRRQDEHIPSLYQEAIKGKVAADLDHWIEKKIEKQSYYNYDKMVSNWVKFLPNAKVIVRPFQTKNNTDIRKDFLQVLGINETKKFKFNEVENFKNQSLSRESVEILRLSNKHLKKNTGKDSDELKQKLRDFLHAQPTGQKMRLSNEKSAEVLKMVENSNKKLLKKHFNSDLEKYLLANESKDSPSPSFNKSQIIELLIKFIHS